MQKKGYTIITHFLDEIKKKSHFPWFPSGVDQILGVNQHLRVTPKRWYTSLFPCFCMFLCGFAFFFLYFLLLVMAKSCFRIKKLILRQQMACRAPVCWSKYPTSISSSKHDLVIRLWSMKGVNLSYFEVSKYRNSILFSSFFKERAIRNLMHLIPERIKDGPSSSAAQ